MTLKLLWSQPERRKGWNMQVVVVQCVELGIWSLRVGFWLTRPFGCSWMGKGTG